MNTWEHLIVYQINDAWYLSSAPTSPLPRTVAANQHTLLNQLGGEGWELVSVFADPANRPRYYMKRPRA